MANYIADIVDVDLNGGSVHRGFLSHTIGSGDIKGNRFGIRAFRNGQEESLSGSCVGYFVRSDKSTVVIEGSSLTSVSGNVAYVTLPEACYAVEGQFTLAIKLVTSSITGTVRIVDGVVAKTTTETIVDPGTLVSNIDDLIEAIEEAVEDIPADYNTAIAPTFTASSRLYHAGEILIKDGDVYKMTVNNDSTWSASKAISTSIGQEIYYVGRTVDGYIPLESGTYSDSDGKTKSANTARQRSIEPVLIDNLAGFTIPDGYEAYVFCLNSSMSKITSGAPTSWFTEYFDWTNCPDSTVYINIAVRNSSNTSADISSQDIRLKRFERKAPKAVPTWNVTECGVYIDGNDVVVNANGFGIYLNGAVYYIAPTDQESVTRFTASNTNAGYILAIDVTKLIPWSRANPSDCIVLISSAQRNIASDRYLVLAIYFKGYWDFSGDFQYFNQVGKHSIEPDYVAYNNSPGGMVINSSSIVINANGFCLAYNGHVYYIAPTDLETITTFTAASTQGTYLLVIDPITLTNPGNRINPSTAMSVIDFRAATYAKYYMTVAVYYKGSWKFNGKFKYFESGTSSTAAKAGLVNNIFNQCHIIAHKGGNFAEENTLANFKAAAAAGLKAVEADVQFTSDNVMVLWHDDTITVGSTTYTIASNSYAQLKAVKSSLTTFEELLQLCKRTDMIIDVDFTKTYTTAQTEVLYQMVKKYGAQSRCLITCFAGTARQLLGYESLPICVSSVTSTSAVDNILDIIGSASIAFCSISYNSIPEGLFDYMHNAGAFVKPWTVDSESTAKTLFQNGADMIISNTLTDAVTIDV